MSTKPPTSGPWDDFFAQPGIDIEEPEDLPMQERESLDSSMDSLDDIAGKTRRRRYV